MYILAFAILILSSVKCNIWDNIYSNSFAPFMPTPKNFIIALTENSTFINSDLGISIAGPNNTIMLEYNISFGGRTSGVNIATLVYGINDSSINFTFGNYCREYSVK